MVLLRRLLGAVLLFLSAVGTIGCTVVIIGTWGAHQKAAQKIQAISDRIDAGLVRVSAANQNVGRAVEKARADIRSVRKRLTSGSPNWTEFGTTWRMLSGRQSAG
jgi:hypothetical protein